MGPDKQNGSLNVDARYRVLLTLWFALLMNIGVLFLFALFIVPAISNEPAHARSSPLIVAFIALGTFSVIVSFVVKRKLLERSVEKQDVNLVQKSLVVACAMCEVSALLGLVERLAIGNREYYLLFLMAAAGTASHFPRREHLLAASYQNRQDVRETWR